MTNEIEATVESDGKKMRIFGILAIILGIFAMLAPGVTGLSVAMVVGWLVVFGGILRMIWAFQARSFGKGSLVFAIGALTLLCGLALVARPLFGAGVLTIVLAIYFIVDGILELVAAFRMDPEEGRGWLIFGGIVSVLLGIMIWRQFPVAGAWAIGILLGIKLFFIGLIMVTTGSALKSLGQDS